MNLVNIIIGFMSSVMLFSHLRSVTDLPYPHHPVSNYVKVPGVCDNQDIIVTSHVSLTTCRYMCDIEVKQPCLGFTYHLPVTADSLTSQCDLIIAICQLNTSSAVGFSYFKLSTS